MSPCPLLGLRADWHVQHPTAAACGTGCAVQGTAANAVQAHVRRKRTQAHAETHADARRNARKRTQTHTETHAETHADAVQGTAAQTHADRNARRAAEGTAEKAPAAPASASGHATQPSCGLSARVGAHARMRARSRKNPGTGDLLITRCQLWMRGKTIWRGQKARARACVRKTASAGRRPREQPGSALCPASAQSPWPEHKSSSPRPSLCPARPPEEGRNNNHVNINNGGKSQHTHPKTN